MTLIFLLTQRAMLGGPVEYLEHGHKVYWRGSKTLSFDVFSAKLSLQSAVMLRNLVWNTCSGFLKNCLNSKISVSKKIRVIRHLQVKILMGKRMEPNGSKIEKWRLNTAVHPRIWSPGGGYGGG